MNDNQLITKESEWIAYFTSSIERIIAKMERMKKDCRPTLGGENFLTDKEVAERLRISRRTLQEYRNEGRITFSWEEKSYIRKVILNGCSKTGIGKPI